jgi:hypothetical protein
MMASVGRRWHGGEASSAGVGNRVIEELRAVRGRLAGGTHAGDLDPHAGQDVVRRASGAEPSGDAHLGLVPVGVRRLVDPGDLFDLLGNRVRAHCTSTNRV